MFLGNPSQRVRDELWKKLTNRPPSGYILQLWSSRLARGFDYRQYGESTRMLEDFEGLALVTRRKPNRKTRMVQRRKGKLFRGTGAATNDEDSPNEDDRPGEKG